MNFFERIPTRWLLVGAALACLALWAAPSSAQTTVDPAAGKRLFEVTANERVGQVSRDVAGPGGDTSDSGGGALGWA